MLDKVLVEVEVAVNIVVGGGREPCRDACSKQGDPPPKRGFRDPAEDFHLILGHTDSITATLTKAKQKWGGRFLHARSGSGLFASRQTPVFEPADVGFAALRWSRQEPGASGIGLKKVSNEVTSWKLLTAVVGRESSGKSRAESIRVGFGGSGQ